MPYITDGAIGINLESPDSASKAALGEIHAGDNGTEWRYILSGVALTRGACVAIGANNQANPLTATTTLMGLPLGFAQTAFAASQYGWVATRGNAIMIQITGAIAAPAAQPLYTSDTAGALSTATASASQFQVFGVFMTTAVAGTTASANAGAAQYPTIRRPA